MKQYFAVYLFICFGSMHSIFAQKHDYHWILGYNSTSPNDQWGGLDIDFNTEPPVMHKLYTPMNFSTFGSSCSDSSGNLLFYSNGIRIFNKNNTLMENGDTLNPGFVWGLLESENEGYGGGYNGICIPVPGKSNHYYIFHVGFVLDLPNNIANFSPLYYTHIDMNANNGLGKVLEKNVVLSNEFLVLPIAVKHGNGRDWWIIDPVSNSGTMYTWLVSPAGIEGPFTQDLGPVPVLPREGGITVISPDGNTYVRSQLADGNRIYDFNRCTGVFGNYRFIPKTTNVYASVFSADSRMLYFQNQRFVSQTDLPALDTAAYMDTLAYANLLADPSLPFTTSIAWPMLAPNQKIYFGTPTTTRKMHIMHHPELPGAAMDLEINGLQLLRHNDATTFNHPNYRLGKWKDSPCDTVMQFGNDEFQRTIYNPARWTNESQSKSRVIQLFPTEQKDKSLPINPQPNDMPDFRVQAMQRTRSILNQNKSEKKFTDEQSPRK